MKKTVISIVICILISCFGCAPEPEQIPEITADDINALIIGAESDDVSFYIYKDEKKNVIELLNKDSITDYESSRFITLPEINADNLKDCFNLFNYEYDWDNQTITTMDNLFDAISSLQRHESDVLIIPEDFVEKLINSSDERIVSMAKRLEKIYQYDAGTMYKYELINKPFLFYAGGSDERKAELVELSRYDVDIILAINPICKQILIVSIPRDMRIPNPAHENKDDKLTHLGDDGPKNVMTGLNQMFDADIKLYGVTNFTEFKRFVDLLGGLDIYNPYTFTNIWKETVYEGNIHLDGAAALRYARERKHLPQNDIDRNKHQAILIKAMINKVLAFDSIDKYIDLIPQIKKSFMTNLDFDQVLTMAKWYLDDKSSWTFFNKQIYGDIEYIWTATYNTVQQLGVITPYQSDIDDVIRMLKTVMSGEPLTE